ncbi:hypothetical protein SAMN05444747_106225 [Variovorax sp. OV329]|nr:hypothetical protein SAMN05444747_106225 [Variovorax sp. OV329]
MPGWTARGSARFARSAALLPGQSRAPPRPAAQLHSARSKARAAAPAPAKPGSAKPALAALEAVQAPRLLAVAAPTLAAPTRLRRDALRSSARVPVGPQPSDLRVPAPKPELVRLAKPLQAPPPAAARLANLPEPPRGATPASSRPRRSRGGRPARPGEAARPAARGRTAASWYCWLPLALALRAARLPVLPPRVLRVAWHREDPRATASGSPCAPRAPRPPREALWRRFARTPWRASSPKAHGAAWRSCPLVRAPPPSLQRCSLQDLPPRSGWPSAFRTCLRARRRLRHAQAAAPMCAHR